ncbi:MAG: hypothetical protein HY689_01985 [Chloroflexi bacterium]|nr:hypothetical protein [Chloroflexota bacterium]
MWLQLMVRYLRLLFSRVAPTAVRRIGGAQEGQSMVEYSIVAALIAVVAMAAVQALGGGVAQVFTNILARISGIGA